MNALRKPNLFIVGAPKCGTTALYSYLRQHPQVFMSARKELHYFAPDICGHQRPANTIEEYLDHFGGAGYQEIVGEASTTYLGSTEAAKAIASFNPDARIIVMLRNPVDLMYAEHSQRLINGTEHVREFEHALQSSEIRTWTFGPYRGERVRRLPYREVICFSRQLQRYFEALGRDRVHVVLYEDLSKDPGHTYEQVLRFLTIRPDHTCNFAVMNPNRRVRSRSMHRILRDPPRAFRQVTHAVLPPAWRRQMGTYFTSLNTVYEPRPALSTQFRARLSAECAGEVRQLAELLGRNFSDWLPPTKSKIDDERH